MPEPTTRLLGHDQQTGLTEYYHFDPVTNGFTLETRQDVGDMIELCKAMANESSGWKGDMHHVAFLPLVILMALDKQGIVSAGGRILDPPRFRAWLNDRDNKAFRMKMGRV